MGISKYAEPNALMVPISIMTTQPGYVLIDALLIQTILLMIII